jgi:hypothetical protein
VTTNHAQTYTPARIATRKPTVNRGKRGKPTATRKEHSSWQH